ncbi:YhgE/Pip domain-containing protein [Streptomyces sp. NPDC001262]|uniref:YhgE/Pip domain-containing protein n=1 Tax=unclassified Streptomyces TaxID=2593676 RepID=UPI0036ADF8D3
MRASTLWKQPRTWVVVVIGGLLAALSTIAYLGPASDPQGRLHDLPLVLVDQDQGARLPGGTDVRLGQDVTARIQAAGHQDGRVAWRTVRSREEAQKILTSGDAYAALVVPQDFSRAALSLVAPGGRPQRPAMTVLTNEGSGGLASSMGEKAARQAAAAASAGLGTTLAERARSGPAAPGADRLVLLQDPVRVLAEPARHISGATAGGSISVYITIALLISGLLPAILLTTAVDAGLGYAPLEVGPRRVMNPVIGIARSTTFLAKAGTGVVMGFVAGSAVDAVAVWGVGVEPDRPVQLWLFCGAACAAVTLLTLALFAVFGTPGQVLALLLVTLFGIPMSGGTIPLEAQPRFADAVGGVLPARHVTEGIRSLVFFDGRGSGLTQACAVLGAYGLGALVVGYVVSRLYDRRGWTRATEHELAHPEAVVAVAG